jgi:chromosome segregation ATPase
MSAATAARIEKARTDLEALAEAMKEASAAVKRARTDAARWAARWESARARLEEAVEQHVEQLDETIGELIEAELDRRDEEREQPLSMQERFALSDTLEAELKDAAALRAQAEEWASLVAELEWDLTPHENGDADALHELVLDGYTAEGARLRRDVLRALSRLAAK